MKKREGSDKSGWVGKTEPGNIREKAAGMVCVADFIFRTVLFF